MLGNKVSWREDGKTYRVRRDGKVESTNPDEKIDLIDKLGKDFFSRLKGRREAAFQRVPIDDVESTE
jgi:hypothetical protein